MRKATMLVSAIAATFLFATAAFAAPLKPEAQAAVQTGLAAAQRQDFPGALAAFLDAQNADPTNPDIWFDLGLASAKLPEYEIHALAWFTAYLAAVPDSPRAAAIRAQMTDLDRSFEARMVAVLDQLDRIVAAAPLTASQANSFNIVRTAARANLGDTKGVRELKPGLFRDVESGDVLICSGTLDPAQLTGQPVAVEGYMCLFEAGKVDVAWNILDLGPNQYNSDTTIKAVMTPIAACAAKAFGNDAALNQIASDAAKDWGGPREQSDELAWARQNLLLMTVAWGKADLAAPLVKALGRYDGSDAAAVKADANAVLATHHHTDGSAVDDLFCDRYSPSSSTRYKLNELPALGRDGVRSVNAQRHDDSVDLSLASTWLVADMQKLSGASSFDLGALVGLYEDAYQVTWFYRQIHGPFSR